MNYSYWENFISKWNKGKSNAFFPPQADLDNIINII
jgi:hypothetical protein